LKKIKHVYIASHIWGRVGASDFVGDGKNWEQVRRVYVPGKMNACPSLFGTTLLSCSHDSWPWVIGYQEHSIKMNQITSGKICPQNSHDVQQTRLLNCWNGKTLDLMV